MQKLYLVGFTTGLDGLILSVRKGSSSGGFVVDLDDALVAQVGDAARVRSGGMAVQPEAGARAPRSSRHGSALNPRELQDRLRAGWTVEEVAAEAGTDVEWVNRFAAPVRAEQARVVDQARAMTFDKPRLGPSSVPLGSSVRRNLGERGLRPPEDEAEGGWSAFQLDEGFWVVRFAYTSRGRAQQAEWLVDLAEGHLVARDRLASQLGHTGRGRSGAASPRPPLQRRRAAKRPPARAMTTRAPEKRAGPISTPAQAEMAVPAKRAAPTKKAAPAKRAAPTKKAPTKKAPTKKAPVKRAAPTKKAPAKRAAPTKKAPARKTVPARKAAPAKRAPAKRAPAKKKAAPAKKAESAPPAAPGPRQTGRSRSEGTARTTTKTSAADAAPARPPAPAAEERPTPSPRPRPKETATAPTLAAAAPDVSSPDTAWAPETAEVATTAAAEAPGPGPGPRDTEAPRVFEVGPAESAPRRRSSDSNRIFRGPRPPAPAASGPSPETLGPLPPPAPVPVPERVREAVSEPIGSPPDTDAVPAVVLDGDDGASPDPVPVRRDQPLRASPVFRPDLIQPAGGSRRAASPAADAALGNGERRVGRRSADPPPPPASQDHPGGDGTPSAMDTLATLYPPPPSDSPAPGKSRRRRLRRS